MTKQKEVQEAKKTPSSKKYISIFNNKVAIYSVLTIAVLLLFSSVIYGYVYASTPSHIRNPKFEHYHFRTQIVVDGKSVDFSKDKFQNKTPGTCSIEPGGTPIDFHDKTDQLTHIHWDGVTGGEFLKYYGWNLIGGSDENLGLRYDESSVIGQTVDRYGAFLPDIPNGSNYYVYIGDANGYEKKDWNNFLKQDLEAFFGTKSNLNQDDKTTLLENMLFPKAYATGGQSDKHAGDNGKTEEELKRINNLIGNVTIFVQKDEPSSAQIKARFSNLVPLKDSICGG